MKPFFTDPTKKTPQIYAAVSAIFALLGILGLLVGYFTGLSPIGHAVAGGEPILKGSLMGTVLEIIRGSIAMPSYNLSYGLAGFLPGTLYVLLVILIGGTMLALASTVAAILLPRFARAISLFNGLSLFFLYTMLFAANALLFLLSEGKLSASPFDLPCFLTALLILGVLYFTAFGEDRLQSVLNAFLFAMNLLSACAFLLPATPLLKTLNAFVSFSEDTFLKCSLLIFCILTAVNIAISVFRLNVKGAYVLDIARFGLQFLSMILLIAAFLGQSGLSFFTDQPLAAVFLLLGNFGAVALSVFCYLVFTERKARVRREKPADAPVPVNG